MRQAPLQASAPNQAGPSSSPAPRAVRANQGLACWLVSPRRLYSTVAPDVTARVCSCHSAHQRPVR